MASLACQILHDFMTISCGNCIFFNELKQSDDGTRAYCDKWDDYVEGGYYCNAWEAKEEVRQVILKPHRYMRAAARQGLRCYEEGNGGEGLVRATIREFRLMGSGDVTVDKW